MTCGGSRKKACCNCSNVVNIFADSNLLHKLAVSSPGADLAIY